MWHQTNLGKGVGSSIRWSDSLPYALFHGAWILLIDASPLTDLGFGGTQRFWGVSVGIIIAPDTADIVVASRGNISV